MIKQISCCAFTLICLCLLGAPFASATVIHNESVDGDLSGVFGLPDPLATVLGANTIIADMGDNGNLGASTGPTDADYFTLVVPAGAELQSITIDNYFAAPISSGGGSLLAFTTGTFFTGQGAFDIVNAHIFNASSTNILGSNLPLGPGSYSFWV